MKRPSFIRWASSKAGLYLYDKRTPTLASWTPVQEAILNHVFPAGSGQLPYSRVIWSDIKKSGKTELAAGVQVYFALYVDTPGEQYCLANDLEGSKSRVWRYIRLSLEHNPALQASDWKVNGQEISFKNGSTIRALPADYRGEAGANLSLATVDEPWGIMHESSTRLMTEFSPVPTRENSLVFYTGYQGFENQSVWWHNLIDNAKRGEPVPELSHIENGDGEPACWRNGRTFLYWNHKPSMPWHTDAYLDEQRRALTASEYLRVWENRRVHNADAFCTAEQWARLFDPFLRALHPEDERRIVLACDAATKSDCTALVGTTWDAEAKRVEVVFVQVWRPQAGRPVELAATVGPKIVELCKHYRVAAVYFDPYQMAAIAEMCGRAGAPMVEFPQTARRTQADSHLHQLLWGGNLAHYGDEHLAEHVTNAVAKQGDRGLRLIKQASAAKIDAAVALSMAALGAVEVLSARRDAVLNVGENIFYLGEQE